MTCVYGGPCGGCMACQDDLIYYPEEEEASGDAADE